MFDRVIGKRVQSVDKLDRRQTSEGYVECYRMEFADKSAITFKILVSGDRVMSIFTPSSVSPGRIPNCS